MSRIGLDEDVPTPVAPPHPVDVGRPVPISTSSIDYGGAGSYGSGQAYCEQIVRETCAMLGIVNGVQNWVTGMATIASRESAYNAAQWQVNLTDSNAIGPIQSDGAPFQSSRGGWQCISQTYAAYHAPGFSNRIYEPHANCASAINYVCYSHYGVARDGSDLTSIIQQSDPSRPPQGYDALHPHAHMSDWRAGQAQSL